MFYLHFISMNINYIFIELYLRLHKAYNSLMKLMLSHIYTPLRDTKGSWFIE